MSKSKVTMYTEDSVKDMLGISDWRKLSKSQIMKFVNEIPHMDKEVAMKCIDQFPEFARSSVEIVKCIERNYKETLQSAHGISKDVIAAQRSSLETIKLLAEREDISFEERKYMTEKMIELTNNIAAEAASHRNFLAFIFKAFCVVGMFALSLLAAVIGIKTPHNKR